VCRLANAEFDGAVTSGASARRFIAERLTKWDLEACTEVAVLLVTELVNNALVHAAGPLTLDLSVVAGVIEIGVSDREVHSSAGIQPKFERLAVGDKEELLAEGGRGLLLVDQLADDWGVAILDTSKEVWFRLHAPEWPYRSDCTCADDTPGRMALHTGGFARSLAGPWDD
jgi:anti-sigma regulatory factor (Ser/Thr protein kinase)